MISPAGQLIKGEVCKCGLIKMYNVMYQEHKSMIMLEVADSVRFVTAASFKLDISSECNSVKLLLFIG